ncbi:MAG: hypothetical protein IJ111_06835 [Eggerthellaceae bacterium]|nr:hypothetical protein [Eggerthellaceae bacterium]
MSGVTDVMEWRGALAGCGAALRRTAAAVLALSCVFAAFTQVGFVGFQFAGGSSAYLVTMLVPVALAACLLGTLPGAACGLFAGAVLYLHSAVMPLDYFELEYVTPLTSVAAMAVCGLLLGIAFALISRGERPVWLRTLLVALACLVVSAGFTAGFSVSTIAMMAADALADGGAGQLTAEQARHAQSALIEGGAAFQAIGDAALMALGACVGFACAESGMRRAADAGLRALFGAWLSAVMLAAFMVVATAAYGAVTAGSLAVAGEDMRDEAEYLLGQVERTAEHNGRVAEAFFGLGGDPDEMLELVEGGMLGSLIAGYTEEGDGLVVVAVGRYVIGADADRLAATDELSDCLDGDALDAMERSIGDGTLERVVYDAPSSESDLVDLMMPGDAEEFSSLVVRQIGYLSAVEHDDDDGCGQALRRHCERRGDDRDHKGRRR